jgi:DNA mismatch repair ATPase MutS
MSSLKQFYHSEVARFNALYGQKTTVAMAQGHMYNFHGDQARLANAVAGLGYNSQDMAGFPKHSLAHWCRRFTDQGYVLVVMEQFTRKKKNGCDEIYRAPVAVYGPGTPIDLPYDCDSAVCAIVYLDACPEVIGYATFESNTGKTQACEFVETSFEAAFGGLLGAALADAPAHTVVVYSDDPAGEASLRRFVDRAGNMRTFGKRVDYKAVSPVTLRDAHVRETIRKQFDDCGLMTGSADTYAGLGGRRHAARAFSHLVHFVFRTNDSKLRIMEQPTLVTPHTHLEVAIGGLRQLDIVGHEGLLDHLPRCCTAAGRRAFKQRVCRPSRDPEEIERRLALAEAAVPHVRDLRRLLTEVKDVECIHRALSRPASFKPSGFFDLVESLRFLKEASSLLGGGNRDRPADAVIHAVTSAVDAHACSHSGTTVFLPGVCQDLDDARERSECLDGELAEFLKHMNLCSGAVSEPHFQADETPGASIEIFVTRKRFEAAAKEAKRRSRTFEIGGIAIPCNDLRLKASGTKKNDTSLTHPSLDKALEIVSEARTCVRDITARLHERHCARIRDSTSDHIFICSREIEDIDVAAANAVLAEERGFVRPAIVSGKGAFFRAKGLRHPIVEHLDRMHEYVSNDVRLDDESRGILLYGINGSGKSVLMKSVGIALCMAQAGMFVAADSLEVGPFARLFTRIWNNDDINRGLSTFKVEASELKQILVNGDAMSMVLGDELCSGTERMSATAIIVAGIQELHDKRCRFLLATHQHDVADVIGDQLAPALAVKHLAVRADEAGDLVYERKLRDGVGETTYGVTVCRALGMPATFIERASSVLRRMQGVDAEYAVSRKTSNYNANVFMGWCERCKAKPAVHTHHRDPQSVAPKHTKNAAFNLEPLCAECHEKHHKQRFAVPTVRVQTTSGIKEIPVDIA